MNINKTDNINTKFSGWLPSGKNAIWVYMANNNINSSRIQKLMDNIEKNSQHYFIDFDFFERNFVIRAFTNKFKITENRVDIMSGRLFNKSLKSCLKKMDNFLMKQNGIQQENTWVTFYNRTFSKIKKGYKLLKRNLLGNNETSSLSKQMHEQKSLSSSALVKKMASPEPITGPIPPLPKIIIPRKLPKAITPEDLLK